MSDVTSVWIFFWGLWICVFILALIWSKEEQEKGIWSDPKEVEKSIDEMLKYVDEK